MSLGLGINGISSYANDPYFAYALSSYNPNFMGTQQTVQQPQVTPPAVDTSASTANLPQADYTEKSSNAGTVAGVIGTALTAGALIYAYKKGKGTGEGLARIKNGFKKIFGIGDNISQKVVQDRAMKEFNFVAKDGSKVYVKDGKIINVAIKGENKVLKTNTEVAKYIKDNKIKIPNYLNGTKLSDGVKLTRYTIEHNGNKFVVENGKIIEAVDDKGKKVAKDKLDDFVEHLKGRKTLEDRISSIEKGTNKHINKLEDVRYIYEKDGLVYSGWTDKGTERLTIPGKLNNKATETEWKAWLNRNDDVDKQVKALIEKGHTDGVAVKNFRYSDKDGNTLFMNEKGEITAIHLKNKPKKGAQTLKPGTNEYDSWLYDNKEIANAAKTEFESGLAPDGATFTAV